MKLVPDETGKGAEQLRVQDEDPLHDPAARKWIDSALKPPRQS